MSDAGSRPSQGRFSGGSKQARSSGAAFEGGSKQGRSSGAAFEEKWKGAAGQESRKSSGQDSRTFGLGASPRNSVLRSFPDLPQDEALEAADKIDAVLRRQGQGEPIHERLKESLTSTLRSRAKISRSLSDLDVSGMAANKGGSKAEMVGGPRAFGQQLAATWRSLPDDRIPGVGGGRSTMLEQLDEIQAARVRGLLTHLEHAVQADPGVKVSDLLAVASSTKGHWFDAPLPPPPPPPLGELEPEEVSLEKILNPEAGVSLFPTEEDWPLQKSKREPRSRFTGLKGVFQIKGQPAEKLMAFRQRLREAHGSLAEAFQMMDIENRGAVSFDHFHTHLVRLKISRTDAEGSIRTLDIFKLLDADGNDLITPNDAIRAFAEAGKDVREFRAEAEAIRKYDENAAAHGFLEGRAHIRFDKKLQLVGDDALRLSTLRRWLEGHFGGFIAGLRAMDVDNTAFIRKEEFVCSLVEGGYCHSAFEAMDLFRVLDVHGYGSLSIEYLAKLEQGEALGADNREARTNPGLDTRPQSGIGSGGLFSDPGRLDGPKPPPRPHLRMQLGNSQVNPDKLYERLFTEKTQSYKKRLEMKKRASDASHVIMDKFLSTVEPETPGSSGSGSRLPKSKSSQDGDKSDSSFVSLWGVLDSEDKEESPEKPPKEVKLPEEPKEPEKPAEPTEPEEPSGSRRGSENPMVAKVPKAAGAMAERAQDAQAAGAATSALVRRRAKLRSAARVGAAMFAAQQVEEIAKTIPEDGDPG